jgi:CYTH domain-containing protein
MKHEIERRWLIPNNTITWDNPIKRRVAYIETNDSNITIRFRQNSDNEFTLTIKQGHGIDREESEAFITKEYFDMHTKDLFVMSYNYQKRIISCNLSTYYEFEIKNINNWTIAEKEFISVDKAKNFYSPTDWLEVTNIEYFNMYNLYLLEKHKKLLTNSSN